MGQLIRFEQRKFDPAIAPALADANDYPDAGTLPGNLQVAISRTIAAGNLLERAVDRLRERLDSTDAAIDAIEDFETRRSLRNLTAMNRKALAIAAETMCLEIGALSALQATNRERS